MIILLKPVERAEGPTLQYLQWQIQTFREGGCRPWDKGGAVSKKIIKLLKLFFGSWVLSLVPWIRHCSSWCLPSLILSLLRTTHTKIQRNVVPPSRIFPVLATILPPWGPLHVNSPLDCLLSCLSHFPRSPENHSLHSYNDFKNLLKGRLSTCQCSLTDLSDIHKSGLL